MTSTALSSPARVALGISRCESLAQVALYALAVCIGLGDIAATNAFTAALLETVHSLLPISIGLAAAAAFLTREWPAYPRVLALPVTFWLAVVVVSAALAPSHRANALAVLDRPLGGVLLALAVGVACRSRLAWLRQLQALAIGGLLIALIALAEATGAPLVHAALAPLHDGAIPIGDIPRVAATLSHPNETAMLLELSLPLLIAWAWTAHSRRRLVLLLASAATLTAIVLTFSRAGAATALFTLGVLAFVALRRNQSRLAIGAGLVTLVVPLALAWTAVVDDGLERRLLAGLDESSAVQPPRTEFWSVAVQMASTHPLLGIGPDNFRWEFASYSGVNEDNLGIHAHNQFLEALADTGVVGALALILFLGGLLSHGARALSRAGPDWPWRAALLASTSAWLVHALLDDFERFWPASVAFWLIAGLSARRVSD